MGGSTCVKSSSDEHAGEGRDGWSMNENEHPLTGHKFLVHACVRPEQTVHEPDAFFVSVRTAEELLWSVLCSLKGGIAVLK